MSPEGETPREGDPLISTASNMRRSFSRNAAGYATANSSMAQPPRNSSTRENFITTLEATSELVEKLVAFLEDEEDTEPLVRESEVHDVVANLVFCADNLTRIEETISVAAHEQEEQKAETNNRRDSNANPFDAIALMSRQGMAHAQSQNEMRERDGMVTPVTPTFAPAGALNEPSRASRRMSIMSRNSHNSNDYLVTARGGRIKKKPRFTRRMIRWLAAAGFIWQILSLSLFMGLSQVWGQGDRKLVNLILGALALFQLCHVFMTIAIMYKIGMQIAHHTISLETLLQSYLSTITAMAGVYFLFMAIDTTAFEGIHAKWPNEAPIDKTVTETDPSHQVQLLMHMFYFSCTVMTGCGFGDITPKRWYAVMCVTLEQLLAVTYSTVIFGLALQHFTTRISLRKRALEKKAKEDGDETHHVDWTQTERR